MFLLAGLGESSVQGRFHSDWELCSDVPGSVFFGTAGTAGMALLQPKFYVFFVASESIEKDYCFKNVSVKMRKGCQLRKFLAVIAGRTSWQEERDLKH